MAQPLLQMQILRNKKGIKNNNNKIVLKKSDLIQLTGGKTNLALVSSDNNLKEMKNGVVAPPNHALSKK